MKKQVVYSQPWLTVALLSFGLLGATAMLPATFVQADEAAAVQQTSDLEKAKALYEQALQYARADKNSATDPQSVVRLFTEAANLGYAPAQIDLGQIYYYGLAGVRDDYQAVAWFRKAAMQGNAKGQYLLGKMYTEGKGGLKESEKEAAVWYLKSAEQGYDPAQYYLAILYLAGIDDIEKNPDKALDLLQKAAKQGNKQAQELLRKLKPQAVESIPVPH